ncbi:MAG: hypothetical protein AB7K52_07720 [Phycisphaerales bacterium]
MPQSGPRESDRTNARIQKIKLVTASTVVVLCSIWIAYVLLSGGGETVLVPQSPCAKLLAGTAELFDDEAFEFVHFQPSEDGRTMTIRGTVKNQKELAQIKEHVEAASAEIARTGEPVQVQWELSVGP